MADFQRIEVASGVTSTLISGQTYTNPNTYTGNGGVACVYTGGTLYTSGANFDKNTTQKSGGAIYNSGAVIVDGGSFTSNGAKYAGVIYNGSNGKMNVSGAVFVSNHTTDDGAVIYNGSSGTVNVSNAIFSGNYADFAGAIDNYNDGTLNLYGVTFTSNRATGYDGGAIYNCWKGKVNVSGVTFTGNSAKRNGGAIYNAQGTVTLSGATFSGNSAKEKGGAIDNNQGVITLDGRVDLQTNKDTWVNFGSSDNATVNWKLTGGRQNYGSINGFQYYSNNDAAKVNQYLVVKTQAEGKQSTGAYVIASGEGLSATLLTANKSGNFTLKAGKDKGQSITIDGGETTYQGRKFQLFNVNSKYLTLAAYETQATGRVDISTGTEANPYNINTSNGDLFTKFGDEKVHGGAINISSGAYASGSNLILIGNTAAFGGAINNSGVLVMDGADFIGNTAGYGGAIYNIGALIISGADFIGNIAQAGGAILNAASGALIISGDATFSGNTATRQGGAIYNNSDCMVNVFGSADFIGNTATKQGGAIYNTSGGVVNVFGSADFIGNTATSGGGAIYNKEGGTVNVSGGATFTGNSTDEEGGAIYNLGKITFSGKTDFSDNISVKDGGAISNGGEITLSDEATFTGNSGQYGGAIGNSDTMTFTASATFTDNKAVGTGNAGGAIENFGGTITFADATFSGNSANNGGAIYNENGMNGEIGQIKFEKAVTFSGNSATMSGGAIFNQGGALTFNGGATFSGNSANVQGGAIYNAEGATVTLSGADFIANSAQYGGAIYNMSGALTFNGGATFSGNTAELGGAINTGEGAIVTFNGDATFSGNSAKQGGAIRNANATVTFNGDATFSGNTATSGGAIRNAGTISFNGTMDLATTTDTWYNKDATVNWNLTGGTKKYGTITHFEQYTNKSNVDQIITVSASQEAGEYTLASGNMSGYATDKTGKYSFKVTSDGKTFSKAITVGAADPVVFEDYKYSLAVNNNKLVLTIATDKLPIDYTLSQAVDTTYDGKTHSVSVTVNDPKSGYTVYYSIDNKQSWIEGSSYSLTDAGSADVYFKIEATDYATTITEAVNITIDQKEIYVEGTTLPDKVYDGNTTATVDKGILQGVIGTDDVKLSATGTFDNKNVGKDKDVTVKYEISGTKAKNYKLSEDSEVSTASITKKEISVTGSTAKDKTYDSTTDATIKAGTLDGKVTGDDVKVNATGSFDTKNAGTDKDVAVSYELSGNDKDNYYLKKESETLKADISQAELSVAGTSVDGKVYDGNADATVNMGTLKDVIGTDDVTLNAAAGVFSDKNAAIGKDVAVSYTISGADKDNYVLGGETFIADITKREISLVSDDATKKYDGSELKKEGVTVGGSGFAGNEGFDYSDFASQTEVGATANTFEYKAKSGTDAANYDVTVVNGSLIVTATEPQIMDDTASLVIPATQTQEVVCFNVTSEDGDAKVQNDSNAKVNIGKVVAEKTAIIENNGKGTVSAVNVTGKDVEITNKGVIENVNVTAAGDETTGGTVTLTGTDGSEFRGENTITAEGNKSKVKFVDTNTFTGKLTVNATGIEGTGKVKLSDVDAELNGSIAADTTFEISGNSKVVTSDKSVNVILEDGVTLSSLESDNATIKGSATLKDAAWLSLKESQEIAKGKTVTVTGENTKLTVKGDTTLTNNGTINLEEKGALNGLGDFSNGGTVNVDVGAAIRCETDNTGTINLKGGYLSNSITNSGTLNWDLSEGNCSKVRWTFINNTKSGKLAITVNANDKLGDSYTIANNAAGTTGTQFTLKGIGGEETTITVGGEAVYNGFFYTLKLDSSNQLVFKADRYANPLVKVTTEEQWFNANNSITLEGTVLDYVGNGIQSVVISGSGLTPATVDCTVTASGTTNLYNWTGSFKSAETLKDGTVLTVSATDKSTPALTGTAKYTLKADGTGPVITVTRDPLADGTVKSSVSVTASAVDALSGFDYMTYSIDDGEATAYIGQKLTFTENSKVLFTAYDKVGNVSTETLYVTDLEAITITADSDTKMYDGSALTDSGYTFNEEALIVGDVLTATVEGSITNVGEVANVVTGYTIMRGSENVTASYIFNASVDGILEVTRRDVTLTSASDTKNYDGTPLTNDTITVSGSGWVEGEGATYNVTGSQTEVGTSLNTFEFICNKGTKAGNYTVNTVYGELTVTNTPVSNYNASAKSDMIQFVDGKVYVTYDGADGKYVQTAAINDVTGWNVVETRRDLTGDGLADVQITADDKAGSTWVATLRNDYLKDGDITLNYQFIGAYDNKLWDYLGSADVNGDGKSEVLMMQTDAGLDQYGHRNVAAWVTDSEGKWVSNEWVGSLLSSEWSVAGTADVTGDGQDNVILRRANGMLGYWSEAGTNNIVEIWNAGDKVLLTSGDFNGDGADDFLFTNAKGDFSTWTDLGSYSFKTNSLGNVGDLGGDWQFAGAGDYDGDGKDELLWCDGKSVAYSEADKENFSKLITIA